jgi:outer membrane murein-binding lipoprotein Lpp
MITRMNRQLIVGSMLCTMVLAGCVSQSKYDALQAQNEQLRQQVASQSAEIAAGKAQISRLQGAIIYRQQ